jgi:ribonucleoside-diphosphate reductase alpha chain
MKELNLWTDTIQKQVVQSGSIQDSNDVPIHIKTLFKTSQEISWKYHLLHQKTFQEFTDNAVSKTINLAANASIEDVSAIYMTAWKYKLKGITIYRYGSKDHQVLQKCSHNNSADC